MTTPKKRLVGELVRRELRQRYLGSLSGGAWALLQPLAQLAIYGYVFGRIFSARLPQQEFGELAFLAFLAIGLWPWNAFAESLSRACTTITDNAGLLGKVAIPRFLLVLAPVAAAFMLQVAGFAAVLLVLYLGGWFEPRWQALLTLPLFVLLALFTLGLAWLFSALTVFVRDIAHGLPQALLLMFFLTPVLYPRSLVPETLLPLADANPLALFVGLFRQSVLGVGSYGPGDWLLAVVLTLASLAAGYLVFQRLAPHFEDFQ
ncbi:ABC transporter permease [Pseudofulvimonas gallinarii]|uniref:Transport permease protein n=2 Tax=Pseudofulvimonas gallinarii TaxID=634155 RepID=A0A4R3LJP5_9GAMM|nr:ABC transporter permease [Pseudofulvimonas gallinarii]TCT00384.1 lipopolysaccharide transport system permease protein [Pseudofulvimonas gallinarii]